MKDFKLRKISAEIKPCYHQSKKIKHPIFEFTVEKIQTLNEVNILDLRRIIDVHGKGITEIIEYFLKSHSKSIKLLLCSSQPQTTSVKLFINKVTVVRSVFILLPEITQLPGYYYNDSKLCFAAEKYLSN
ncbi:MAG: hypothetical protein ACJAV6_000432 [Candidatus Paceibacteria bacterium]|jgi:hypothetical protein